MLFLDGRVRGGASLYAFGYLINLAARLRIRV